MNILPVLAFCALCTIYGTSYAFVSSILGTMNEAALSVLRMIFACLATFGYFGYRYFFEPNYSRTVHESIRTGATPIPKAIFCGIFSLGIPISAITMAQRSVPSTIVTLSQPIIPLVTMVIAHLFLADEKISAQKLILSLVDLFGAVLTMIPTFSPSSDTGEHPYLILDYLLLMVSIFCFGVGSIYLKVVLCNAELTLSCCCSTFGATVYTLVSALLRLGPTQLLSHIFKSSSTNVFYTLILGVIYSCIPTFLFMYIVRTLGAVKANLTNFGQIVIGTFAGVFFLDEMKGYKQTDKMLTWIGVLVIIAALLMEFMIDSKKEKESKLKDNEALINEGSWKNEF